MKEADQSCDLYVCGKCHKGVLNKNTLCKNFRSDKSWFTDKLKLCEVGEVCRRASIFGNAYYAITPEQIELLKQGKVLYDLDEYGTFIMLKVGKE